MPKAPHTLARIESRFESPQARLELERGHTLKNLVSVQRIFRRGMMSSSELDTDNILSIAVAVDDKQRKKRSKWSKSYTATTNGLNVVDMPEVKELVHS